jgi:hypothetical protein
MYFYEYVWPHDGSAVTDGRCSASDNFDCADWLLYTVRVLLLYVFDDFLTVVVQIVSPRMGSGRGVVHGRVSYNCVWSLPLSV